MEKEITRPVRLSHSNGKLNHESVGWSRHPMILSHLEGNFLRKKKWNYWCITSPDVLVSITVSHLDYAAMIFAYILDIHSKDFSEKSILLPLGKGLTMPDLVQETIEFRHQGITISFQEHHHETRIFVQWQNFYNENPLRIDLTVDRPPHQESLNVVIPWSDKRYQFTSKQVALDVHGSISWASGEYELSQSESFATLDFGRGKWPYRSKWNWGAASGYANGQKIGLNFGGQWTKGTGVTENGFVIEDKLHKIHEELEWIYDRQDYMKPWMIHSPNQQQVKLMFEPFYERIAKTNIGVIKSEVHQMIGHYSGTIETNDGQQLQIDRLLGWAEDHVARW